MGSLAETEYLVEFSERLGYLSSEKAAELYILIAEVSKLLWGFKKSL
jgi:four helix bundle protein